jgi:osmotically inducible protein OsmC
VEIRATLFGSTGRAFAVHRRTNHKEPAHMSISKASAKWDGSLKDGKGAMKPAHAAEVPFSLQTRFQGAPGSNPEEMIGAALAGCFSMALSASLGKANLTPTSIETTADVHLDKEGEGFKISKIELKTKANVPGLDKSKFAGIAEETKKNCPVSKALGGTTIELQATLL